MYILKGKKAVRCDGPVKWAESRRKSNNRVALAQVGNATVSTVFVGRDDCIFETRVFGGHLEQEVDRYTTWEEAEEGHIRMVKRVMEGSDV